MLLVPTNMLFKSWCCNIRQYITTCHDVAVVKSNLVPKHKTIHDVAAGNCNYAVNQTYQPTLHKHHIANNNWVPYRGGARGGLEGAIAPLSEGEKLFCRRFLVFTIP